MSPNLPPNSSNEVSDPRLVKILSALTSIATEDLETRDIASATEILAKATKIYANALERCNSHRSELPVLDVDTTEAVSVANAMLVSQNLSVFEFSVWSQSRRDFLPSATDQTVQEK